MKHRNAVAFKVRVDVFVNTPMVVGWFGAYTSPGHYHPTNDETLLKACRVYQAWIRSLEKQSARAKATQASAVRLVVDALVVAGFGNITDDKVWTENGARTETLKALRKRTKRLTSPKKKAKKHESTEQSNL